MQFHWSRLITKSHYESSSASPSTGHVGDDIVGDDKVNMLVTIKLTKKVIYSQLAEAVDYRLQQDYATLHLPITRKPVPSSLVGPPLW